MAQDTIHSKFLIHWTGKDIAPYNNSIDFDLRKKYVDRLKDVLQNGLYMKPGEEIIYGVNNTWVKAKIARVCFTEIKLSQTKTHATRYGRLGIGFSRDFVLEREGNPVFYVQNGDKGHIIENFDFLRGFLGTLPDSTEQEKKIKKDKIKELEIILGYLKNMSCRNENELKYYDEMEWRVVHVNRLEGPTNYIRYNEETTREGEKIYRLKIEPKDVRLIVFPDNETIRLAFQDEGIVSYFNSYVPTLIALDDCENF